MNIIEITRHIVIKLKTPTFVGILCGFSLFGPAVVSASEQIVFYCLKPLPPIASAEFYTEIGVDPRDEYAQYFDQMTRYYTCLEDSKWASVQESRQVLSDYQSNFPNLEK